MKRGAMLKQSGCRSACMLPINGLIAASSHAVFTHAQSSLLGDDVESQFVLLEKRLLRVNVSD